MHKSLGRFLLVLGLLAMPFSSAAAKKFDFTTAFDPLTLEPVVVCVGCWFWSCDC